MKTMKILFTLVVFVMMGLTVSAQTKKDTTVIFKVGIHCPSCKAKLDKDMPFEKGIKDYKLNMKDSTVLISFRTDKNSVEAPLQLCFSPQLPLQASLFPSLQHLCALPHFINLPSLSHIPTTFTS